MQRSWREHPPMALIVKPLRQRTVRRPVRSEWRPTRRRTAATRSCTPCRHRRRPRWCDSRHRSRGAASGSTPPWQTRRRRAPAAPRSIGIEHQPPLPRETNFGVEMGEWHQAEVGVLRGHGRLLQPDPGVADEARGANAPGPAVAPEEAVAIGGPIRAELVVRVRRHARLERAIVEHDLRGRHARAVHLQRRIGEPESMALVMSNVNSTRVAGLASFPVIGDRKLGSGVGWNPHVVAGNPDRRAFD